MRLELPHVEDMGLQRTEKPASPVAERMALLC